MTFIVFIVCNAVVHTSTGTAGTAAVVTTGAAASVTGVFQIDSNATTTITSTTGYEVKRCSFFDVSGNGYMTAALCLGGCMVGEFLRHSAAASAPQVNLVSCIERCGPRGKRLRSAVCIERLVSGANILLIDVEKYLFVGSVILFHIIAMILDSIAPEPLPDFFRVRVFGIQGITIFQVRSIVFIRVFQPTTSIDFNAQLCHCFALNIDGFRLCACRHIATCSSLHCALITDRCVNLRFITG